MYLGLVWQMLDKTLASHYDDGDGAGDDDDGDDGDAGDGGGGGW